MHDTSARELACTSTFLRTHRFHALSDKLIWGGRVRCLQFLKEFHALDVVVVPKFCHRCVLSLHLLLDVLDGSPHGRVHSIQCSPSPRSPRPGHRVSDFASSRPKLFMFSCFSSVLLFVVASRAGCPPRLGRCVGKSLLACGDRQQLGLAPACTAHCQDTWLAPPPNPKATDFPRKKYSHLCL